VQEVQGSNSALYSELDRSKPKKKKEVRVHSQKCIKYKRTGVGVRGLVGVAPAFVITCPAATAEAVEAALAGRTPGMITPGGGGPNADEMGVC